MQAESIPNEPVSNGAPARSGDTFVDAGLDALRDLAKGPPDNANGKPARQPRTEEQRPSGEDGDAEEEQSLPGAGDDEGDEQNDEEAGDEGEAHDTRGSKDNPLKVKDLSDEIHVEVKVDGKTETVTLKEALDGYVGQKTINQRLNQAKAFADEVQQLQARVTEERQKLTSAVREVLSDPDQLYDYLMATEEREQGVLFRLAHRYAEQTRQFRQNPEQRLAFQRQRDIARIQAEREHFENQRREQIEAQQRKEAEARAVSIFKPGWESGLKRAGFPQMDASQQQTLLQEVMLRCEQRQRAGKEVTSDDVAEFVTRAVKILELPPKGAQRPRPAPARAPKDRPAQRRGEDPWAGKSSREKLKSPDFFLKGLKPRDFR